MAMDSSENTYLNDPENGAEMARLLDQDRTLTKAMNGLLSEQSSVENFHDVLDIACGPGGWVQEVAFVYPQMQVTGIDISKAMIDYAIMQARLQHLENAHFKVMDATRPLDFPDASFDLVNARTIAGFMLTSSWPPLLRECQRILRPGGIIRLTETDLWGTTNSNAFGQLSNMVMMSLFLSKHSFDASGNTFGITPMLKRLLGLAGFRNIETRPHAIDFSAGAAAYSAMYQNFSVFYKIIQPFLFKTQRAFPQAHIPDQDKVEQLYNQMLTEMLSDDFVGIIYMLTAWGQRL